ncbi:MAG TPA: sigma-70 family RNA polymerase sigma factor [Candidatus Acidoferrales bacterium]|nr:sigma-70 family RNA polymerase sigma factor [Candidatus Acidoferrales bacterium]
MLAALFLAVLEQFRHDEQAVDAALMERLIQKDPRALEALYDRHSRAVYSLVLRILQQAASAEEVVQDIFLQLWRNAHQFQAARGPLLPWLLTMARNRALDHLRLKRERQRQREDALDPEIAAVRAPDFEAEIDRERRAARVRACIRALPAPQQKAIEMAFFEGMSHSEIAAALSEPLGTVKSWIRNGLLRLKEGLQTAT